MTTSHDAPAEQGSEQPRTQPLPPRRRRGRETALDMVRSMVVILAVVALIYVLVPRPSSVPRGTADVSGAVASALDAWDEPGGAAPAREPSLPEGWNANGASFRGLDGGGAPTLHVGYLTAGQEYAALDVSPKGTDSWVSSILGDSRQVDVADVAGHRVDRWESLRGDRRGYVLRLPAEQVGAKAAVGETYTYLVGGTATWDELTTLAEATLPR